MDQRDLYALCWAGFMILGILWIVLGMDRR